MLSDIDVPLSSSRFSLETKALLAEAQTTADPREDLFNRMLQRRMELADEIRILKKAHNELNTACKLLPEILGHIFSFPGLKPIDKDPIRRAASFIGAADEKPIDVSSLIRATHVCQRWRNIAINLPSLWNTPSFVNAELGRLMLDRSKGIPLNVVYTSKKNNPGLDGLLVDALSQAQRLRTIEVEADGDERFWKTICSRWASSPSQLERLKLTGNLRNANPPTAFIEWPTPALRHLELHTCRVPWEKLPLGPQLTHLSLAFSIRPSTKDFFASLKEMTLLETLALVGILPTIPEKMLRKRRGEYPHSFMLPFLRHLQLNDNGRDIAGFLELLRAPALETMDISLRQEVGEGADDRGCLDHSLEGIRGRLDDMRKTKETNSSFTFSPAHLAIENMGHGDRVYSVWYAGRPITSTPTLRMYSLFMQGPGTSVLSSKALHEWLDLSGTSSLTITGDENADRYGLDYDLDELHETWKQELCHEGLQAVRTIRMESNQNVMRAVFPAMREEDRWFPDLRSVTASKIMMHADRNARLEEMVAISEALKARRGFSELNIEGCTYFSMREYEYLTKELPSVQIKWDMLHLFKRI